MKGKQRREEPMFACVRLEDLIPQGRILRKIDRRIDFSIIHEKTEDLYSSTGRPSIDPEVLIRMMVVGKIGVKPLRPSRSFPTERRERLFLREED